MTSSCTIDSNAWPTSSWWWHISYHHKSRQFSTLCVCCTWAHVCSGRLRTSQKVDGADVAFVCWYSTSSGRGGGGFYLKHWPVAKAFASGSHFSGGEIRAAVCSKMAAYTQRKNINIGVCGAVQRKMTTMSTCSPSFFWGGGGAVSFLASALIRPRRWWSGRPLIRERATFPWTRNYQITNIFLVEKAQLLRFPPSPPGGTWRHLWCDQLDKRFLQRVRWGLIKWNSSNPSKWKLYDLINECGGRMRRSAGIRRTGESGSW